MSAIESRPPLAPRDAREVAEIVRTHARALEPLGGGSKRVIGRPVDGDPLDLSALTGVLDYAPEELVLTTRAATPLDALSRLLAANGQRLAFEPPDYGALLGVRHAQTIGGVLATNLAGSRRVSAGAARDHFLGFEAVSGRGETFRAGGKVVKNVTGYDLPKLLAGSWGTLALLTEVTVRVAAAPETERTLLFEVADACRALEVMTLALASAFEVSAAAYDPRHGVALRLEGFDASVHARQAGLLALLDRGSGTRGTPSAENAAARMQTASPAGVLESSASRDFWSRCGDASALADWPVVWRISVPPSHAPQVLGSLEPERYLLDWGGGLIWAAYGGMDADVVRRAIREGHATLIKAPPSARLQTCTFQPPSASVAAVRDRIKDAFDPQHRLNPRRMD